MIKKEVSYINDVVLIGTLERPFEYEHNVGSSRVFSSFLLVRKHAIVNRIPVSISENMLRNINTEIFDGKIKVKGYIISFTVKGNLSVSVRITEDIVSVDESTDDVSCVKMSGVVCKKPELREKKDGKQVCNYMIRSRTPNGNETYMPVVAWGALATTTSKFKLHSTTSLTARFHSRKYVESIANGVVKEKEVYELYLIRLR